MILNANQMLDLYDIQIDDLPPEYREVAEAIGLKPALELVKLRGGDGLYVPKSEKVCRAARNRAIRAEFDDGSSYRDLAHKYTNQKPKALIFTWQLNPGEFELKKPRRTGAVHIEMIVTHPTTRGFWKQARQRHCGPAPTPPQFWLTRKNKQPCVRLTIRGSSVTPEHRCGRADCHNSGRYGSRCLDADGRCICRLTGIAIFRVRLDCQIFRRGAVGAVRAATPRRNQNGVPRNMPVSSVLRDALPIEICFGSFSPPFCATNGNAVNPNRQHFFRLCVPVVGVILIRFDYREQPIIDALRAVQMFAITFMHRMGVLDSVISVTIINAVDSFFCFGIMENLLKLSSSIVATYTILGVRVGHCTGYAQRHVFNQPCGQWGQFRGDRPSFSEITGCVNTTRGCSSNGIPYLIIIIFLCGKNIIVSFSACYGDFYHNSLLMDAPANRGGSFLLGDLFQHRLTNSHGCGRFFPRIQWEWIGNFTAFFSYNSVDRAISTKNNKCSGSAISTMPIVCAVDDMGITRRQRVFVEKIFYQFADVLMNCHCVLRLFRHSLLLISIYAVLRRMSRKKCVKN